MYLIALRVSFLRNKASQASAAQVVRHESLRQLVVLCECSPEFHSQEACVGFSHWVFPYTLIIPLVSCTHTSYGRAWSVCVANL